MIKNKKGFTLVELLAVIVVLAIIMIIAIPAVMTQMNNARVGTFKVYGQKVLAKAEETYQADLLFGTSSNCYTFTKMGLDKTGDYRGKVTVTVSTDGKLTPTFSLYLSDNSYSVAGISETVLNGLKPDSTQLSKTPFAASHASATCP